MFNAAFSSLSISCPHSTQRYILSVNSSKDFTCPQAEHIFDDGYHLSILSNSIPTDSVCAIFTEPTTGSLMRRFPSYRSCATPDAALNDPAPVLRLFLKRGGPAE